MTFRVDGLSSRPTRPLTRFIRVLLLSERLVGLGYKSLQPLRHLVASVGQFKDRAFDTVMCRCLFLH